MTWTKRQFSKNQVDDAGDALISPTSSAGDIDDALLVINNWRASHSFPLNTFKMGLLGKCVKVDSKSIVAQRIRRLSSIRSKLQRFSGMKLSRMQDIAGARAIVQGVPSVYKLAQLYKKKRGIKHQLIREDDYIANPKSSGYRGVHLVYRYFSDRQETYNGLSVEVQLRSRLQHAWATAVETVGIFVQHSLKSSQGPDEWLRFFALMSTAFANWEGHPTVPDTPQKKSTLRSELRHWAKELDVENRLRGYGTALQVTADLGKGSRPARYFVVELNLDLRQLKVRGYKKDQLEQANDDYAQTERRITLTDNDAVLVSVDSLLALRKAYPNYYLDTHYFIGLLKQATK
jgi:RelA/SpoT family protein